MTVSSVPVPRRLAQGDAMRLGRLIAPGKGEELGGDEAAGWSWVHEVHPIGCEGGWRLE